MSTWQPIETAPQKGILLGFRRNDDNSAEIALMFRVKPGETIFGPKDDKGVEQNCWFSLATNKQINPTHWAPLPSFDNEEE